MAMLISETKTSILRREMNRVKLSLGPKKGFRFHSEVHIFPASFPTIQCIFLGSFPPSESQKEKKSLNFSILLLETIVNPTESRIIASLEVSARFLCVAHMPNFERDQEVRPQTGYYRLFFL